MVLPNDENQEKELPSVLDPESPAAREMKELEKTTPQPEPEVSPWVISPPPTVPKRELEKAPAPVENVPLDFTAEMQRQGLLPFNWPRGVSVFQDVDLALSNLPAQKQEMLVRELLQFLPENERRSFLQDVQGVTGGQIIPLSDEEWRLAHVRPTKKWYEKALGRVSSFTEKPVVAQVMDALQWPSDRMEPVLGSLLYPTWSRRWWWDAPDGYSVWEHSTLYYDILGTALQHSDFSGTLVKEVDAAMLRGEEWYNDPFEGIDWENVPAQKRQALQEELVSKYGAPGIYQQFQNVWMDAIYKGFLDPLWLVGGSGFLVKPLRGIPVLGRSATWGKIIDVAEFGVIGGGKAPFKLSDAKTLAKMPLIGRGVRLLKGIGVHRGDVVIGEALGDATAYVDRANRASKVGKPSGFVARLFKLSPEASSDEMIRNAHNLLQQTITDPRVAPKDMEVMLDAIRTGDLSKAPAYLPVKFMTNEDAAKLGEVLRLQKVRGNQLKSTAKTILTPDEFDLRMEAALDEGPKAARKFQQNFSRGREAWQLEFMDDAQSLLSPAIAASWGHVPGGAVQSFFGWNKRILSATLLDTPGFAQLNTMYNTTSSFIAHGFRMFQKGLLKGPIKKFMREYDIAMPVIDVGSGDSHLARQLGTARFAGKRLGPQARPSKMSWILPFVGMASWTDAMVRLKSFQIGVLRTFRHNWHNIMTPIPNEVARAVPEDTLTHLRALGDSAAEPGYLARLDVMEEMIDAGRSVTTTATLRDEWIDTFARIGGKAPTGRVRRLVQERFDQLGLTDALDEVLHGAGSVEDLARRTDEVRVSILSDIDDLRQTQHLEPISHLGPAPAEDLAELTARRREIKNLIQEGTVTDPQEVARLEDEFVDVDRRMREARAAMGTPGENLYSINVADDKLGKARVEMTDLWLQSHGFESGVARSRLNEYLAATRRMYGALSEDRQRIFAAANAGEAGVDAMWEGYRVKRLQELTDNLAALERLIGEHNPSLLPSFRVIRDIRLDTMSAKDRALRLAFEAGEDIRYEVMGPTRTRIDQWITQEIRTERGLMGLAPKPREFNAGMYDSVPVMGEAMTGELQWAREFINWAEPKMVQMFTSPPTGLSPEARAATKELLNLWRGDYKDLQLTAVKVGRALTDHLWYDYSKMYGADKIIQWIMPYHFWPTRTMWLWGQRTLANPGAMASIAKAYDLMEEMTSELPRRMQGDFELPIPLIGDKLGEMYGPATKMFWNPTHMMFPTMQWSEDFRSEERQGTLAGRLLDYWGTVGPGVHPFVPIGGSLVGLLERESWVNRNYPRSLPFGIPGTTAQMAIAAFLNGADVDLPEWITDDDMSQLIGGSGLPLNKLQRVLGVPPDKWDTYRIDRSLAGVFLEESKGMTSAEAKVLLRDFLEAADTKSGPYWEKARQLASTEAGIRYLSGWAFISVQIYPEGEQLMRALDPIYRMYAARGQLEEFYERWPEYQLRRVALAGVEGEEGRTEEIHKSLFWYDLSEAMEEREKDLEPVYAALDAIQEKEEFYNSKVGRHYRSMYEQEQYQVINKWQDEINQIYARYEDVDKTPSAQHDPYTRALMSLRGDYYDIRLEDFLPKGKTRETATEEEVLKADELYQQAREDFVLALPSSRVKPELKFGMAVEHYKLSILGGAAVDALAREGKGGDISRVIEQRTADQLALMSTAKSMVSRYDFELFLNRGKTPPSAVKESYQQASNEMKRYMAMADLNIPTKAKKELRTSYWETHPLLERFYGNEPVGFTTAEAAAAYARLDEIRAEYYSRDGVAQLNYIYSVLDEFNELLDKLGLPVVTLQQLNIGDERRWDLAIPGVGFPPAEQLEYSIEKRYSDASLTNQ